MSWLVPIGEAKGFIPYNGGVVPDGHVVYDGEIITDPYDEFRYLMVWDGTILPAPGNVREMTTAEVLVYRKEKKVEELKREMTRRTVLINAHARDWDTIDWSIQLYFLARNSIIPSARGTIDWSQSPDLEAVNNIRVMVLSEIDIINAYTLESEVLAYDVVNTPVWP